MSWYDVSDIERRRTRRAVAILAGFVAVLLTAAALASSSASALDADRPNTTDAAPPAAVFGLAASDAPSGAALSFVSLPPPPALSGLAAGSEAGRQEVATSRDRGSRDAVDGGAPAGPDVPMLVQASGGLALLVPPLGTGSVSHHGAVPLPPIADAIAACESGQIDADGRPVLGTYSLTAANHESSARGKYQAVTATWEWVTGLPAPASAYPEHVQDQFFVDLWDDGRGAHHWDASRWCWAGAA